MSAGEDQAARLDERLTSSLALGPPEYAEARETREMVESLLADILEDVIKQTSTNTEEERAEAEESQSSCHTRRKSRSSSGSSRVPTALVEIDCTGPDITVSQVDREAEAGTGERETDRRQRQRLRVVEAGDTGGQAVRKHKGHKRKGGRKYPKTGKDARARFKSSEDLIHRLYVCISGAADQLQTNFAGDFRSILKYVFIMNSSQDDQEEEEDAPEQDEKSQESLSLSDNEESDVNPELSPDTVSLEAPEAESSVTSETRPVMIRGQRGYECGEDALMSESEQNYLRSLPNQAPGPGPASAASIDPRLLSTSPPAGLAAMPVYASNLDYHMGETGVLGAAESEGPGPGTERRFYQPEPALLTIASGDRPVVREEAEADLRRERRLEEPPAWIPDSMAPLCMGCGLAFSLVRRRHHCRSCGRVFCAKCSPNQVTFTLCLLTCD